MNYLNHVLRSNIQEWYARLYKSPYDSFGERMQIFFSKLQENRQISGIHHDLMVEYPFDEDNFSEAGKQLGNPNGTTIGSEKERIALYYGYLTSFFKIKNSYNLHQFGTFNRRDFHTTKEYILERFISPIVGYIHDQLDESNSVTYLLEKYKKRTEWFTHNILLEAYKKAEKNYEQIFEDDLRLYLFDQGIEYPFSTPKSSSGRSDIIGQLETDDPVIVEIKYLAKDKGYGKNRVIDGYNQALQYLNDYNKPFGYLVVFITDQINVNITGTNSNRFPIGFTSGYKTVYIVFVQLNFATSASKLGKSEPINIDVSEFEK